MKIIRKTLSIILSAVFVISSLGQTAYAEEVKQTRISPNTFEMIQTLDEISQDLGNGIISIQEYDAAIIDIYELEDVTNNKAITQASDYYPEVQAGYINNAGVEYLYHDGLRYASTAGAAIGLLLNFNSAAGWGLSAISVVCAYGGKSALESAVDQAHSAGLGIKVYYQIHKSITSLNRVRYVVG